jgi:hypothetical protein
MGKKPSKNLKKRTFTVKTTFKGKTVEQQVEDEGPIPTKKGEVWWLQYEQVPRRPMTDQERYNAQVAAAQAQQIPKQLGTTVNLLQPTRPETSTPAQNRCVPERPLHLPQHLPTYGISHQASQGRISALPHPSLPMARRKRGRL